MTARLAALLCALALGGAAAAEDPPLGQPAEERDAQAALPRSPDAIWTILAATKIDIDPDKGIFTAAHPAEVKALAGKTMTIAGFTMPLDTDETSRHFLLTRNTPVCPFCPPGEPNEVIEVWSDEPVKLTYDLAAFTGRFELIDNGEQGLFFQLKNAAPAP